MAFEYWLHCDDVGISKKSVEAIWPLFQSESLQGASLFVNGPGTEDFFSRIALERKSKIRLGAHLSLTNGPSTLSRDLVPLLVNSKGYFCHGFLWYLLANFFHPKKRELKHQIEGELCAQLEKFQNKLKQQTRSGDLQIHFLGYDGHNHIHVIPLIFQILKNKFPLLRSRTVVEPVFCSSRVQDQMSFRYLSNWPKFFLLRALHLWNTRGRKSQRACLGILYSGIQNVRTLQAGIGKSRNLGIEELEIIVHCSKVSANDHEGDYFGQDLLDFLRCPSRTAEAQAVEMMK